MKHDPEEERPSDTTNFLRENILDINPFEDHCHSLPAAYAE